MLDDVKMITNKRMIKHKIIGLTFIFSVILSSFIILKCIDLNNNCTRYNSTKILTSNSNNFNILTFWDQEIERVNNTLSNIELGENSTLKYTNPNTKEEYDFIVQEIHFDSPNWVDATPTIIKLHGYLLYPEELKNKNPGCLCMHGLGGNANKSFEFAAPYLENGFMVLCHSHPGHGKSEGTNPTPNNFYYEGEYNKSSHNYLTLCGAIQGLRVLESLDHVNNSEIMVTGSSYGGLNTMYLSGVCGERIAGAIPYIAAGDYEKNNEDPTKLLFWVWNKNINEIPDSYWNEQNLRTDPIYYLASDKVPPIFWEFGTTDEFFYHHCIINTYETVNHTDKYLQIHPNGHHGLFDYENTTKFFIDYIISKGSAPPKIDIKDHIKGNNILGDYLEIEVHVDSDVNIESVQVVYKYLDIIGTCWEKFNLEESEEDIWAGILNSGVITSNVDYFIIVNLEGENNVWFSSKINTVGKLFSNLSIPFYILFIAFISFPAILLIWRRYKKNVKELEDKFQRGAKKNLILEVSLLGITEMLFFISLILPIAEFGNSGVSWSSIFVFNKLYTWKAVFGSMAPFLTSIFLIIFILFFHISLMKPIIAGFFKIAYFLYALLLYSVISGVIGGSSELDNFGIINLGIGFYLILIVALMYISIGVWKRYYQINFRIREPKRKFYNIDRWFRLKSSSKKRTD